MGYEIDFVNNIKYAEDIVNIWAKGFDKNITQNDILIVKNRILDNNYKIYITKYEDEVISCVTYKIGEDESILNWISTLLFYRNHGIASNMIEYSLKEISNITNNVILYCNTSKLEKFYHKFGFEKVNEIEIRIPKYNKALKQVDTMEILQRKMKLRIR